MSDPALPQVNAGAGAATQINENFESGRPAMLFGRDFANQSGLNFGLLGGIRYRSILTTAVVLTLANNATNYVVVLKSTGVPSVSTTSTNWNSGLYDRLYLVTTSSGAKSSVEDHRMMDMGNTSGLGTVTGPVSSTDNNIPRWDGTSGTTLQDSGITLSDNKEVSGYRLLTTEQTGTTYTMQESDSGTCVEFSNAGAITITLPNSLPKGFWCLICSVGAGQVSFSLASGVVALRNRSSHTKLVAQWSEASLRVRANSGGSAAEYVLSGDTTS